MALFELAELRTWVRDATIDDAAAALVRDMATTYLESEVGVVLSEQANVAVTYTPRWDDRWISLPVPTTNVSSVSVDGSVLGASDYQFHRDTFRLFRRVGWGGARWLAADRIEYTTRYIEDEYAAVDVTLTYGFHSPPGEFKLWGLVLAAQAYQLTPSLNRQAVRIDDFAETFATGGDLAALGIELPPRVLGRLKNRYGRGAAVVDAR